MNIDFITDPEMAPHPRDEIEITHFAVTPYPDGRRFRLDIEMTPFAPVDRPSLEIAAVCENGEQMGSVSVIDSMHRALSLTMHIKQADVPFGAYTFTAQLYYEPDKIQHQSTVQIHLPDDIPAAS